MCEDGNDGAKNGFRDQLDGFAIDELTEIAKPIAEVYLTNDGRVNMLKEVDTHEDITMAIVGALAAGATGDVACSKGVGW